MNFIFRGSLIGVTLQSDVAQSWQSNQRIDFIIEPSQVRQALFTFLVVIVFPQLQTLSVITHQLEILESTFDRSRN